MNEEWNGRKSRELFEKVALVVRRPKELGGKGGVALRSLLLPYSLPYALLLRIERSSFPYFYMERIVAHLQLYRTRYEKESVFTVSSFGEGALFKCFCSSLEASEL